MRYYGGPEMARSFRTVRKNTIQIAEEIPQDKYGFRPATDMRTVEKLLTHIALIHTFNYQLHAVEKRTALEGFDFTEFLKRLSEEEAKPRSKAEVIAMLRENGEAWAGYLEGLSEDFLAEQVSMMPGTEPASKSRFEMLIAPKEHEMHHRGQLMLIQRMLGLVPHLTRQMQERMAARQAKS
jgi:uncharacterized damage-inducible protein DinB